MKALFEFEGAGLSRPERDSGNTVKRVEAVRLHDKERERRPSIEVSHKVVASLGHDFHEIPAKWHKIYTPSR